MFGLCCKSCTFCYSPGMEKLTDKRLRELLNYEPETGLFIWKVDRPPRAKAGSRPTSPTKSGYLRASIDGKTYYQHRLAWLYTHGDWPKGVIDHINGDVSDNRINNLRDVNHSTNLQNLRRARSDSQVGLIGVHRRNDTGRYTARIQINGRNATIGCFDSPEAAHEAYLSAKRAFHEGCTL